MPEVSSVMSPSPIGETNVYAVKAYKAYTGLQLEPPTKDVVSFYQF